MIAEIALLVLGPLLSLSASPVDDVDLKTLLRIEGRVQQILPEAIRKTVAVRVSVMGQEAYGSGAHIGDGFILTCAHVVENADPEHLAVVLSDGTEHEAERLGMNRVNDYALIRIDRTDLPAFGFGDSAALEVGEWVGALGHPGGPYPDHQPAFSLGQVTGLGKQLPLVIYQKHYTRAIQTNTQIFAGNSGGPLFDLDGRLLGINGAILLVKENGYAVPIDQIEPDLPSLRAGEDVEGERIEDPGKAIRELQRELSPEDYERLLPPWFREWVDWFTGEKDGAPPEDGLPETLRKLLEEFFGTDRESPLPMDNRARLGITVPTSPRGGPGIEILTVEEDGASDRAGLRPGDRLLAIDGVEVSSLKGLQDVLFRHEPGDRVKVDVSRNGWMKTVEVTLQR